RRRAILRLRDLSPYGPRTGVCGNSFPLVRGVHSGPPRGGAGTPPGALPGAAPLWSCCSSIDSQTVTLGSGTMSSAAVSGRLDVMTKANDSPAAGGQPAWRWDVALSFAGAQRDYVEQVAEALKAQGVRCFYDADEEIELWGKYLAEELPDIYGEQAAAVMVFISAEYAERDWTILERRGGPGRGGGGGRGGGAARPGRGPARARAADEHGTGRHAGPRA